MTDRGAVVIAMLAGGACGYPSPVRSDAITSSEPDGYAPNGPVCGAPGTWATAASLPEPVSFAAMAPGGDGRLYLMGGIATGVVSTVLAYTPSTDRWEPVASMPTARSNLAAVAGADGRVYAIGGNGSGTAGALATTEVYTPSTDSWASLPEPPTARAELAATLGPDGRIYAVGGVTSTQPLDTFEAFDPSMMAWHTEPSLPLAREYLGAATGADGRLYVVGGYEFADTAETNEYTTGVESWGDVADLPDVLGDVHAIAVGGNIYAFGMLGSAYGALEVYSIASDTWTAGPSMPTPREAAAVALGADGCIYVAGGDAPNGATVATVEVYSP